MAAPISIRLDDPEFYVDPHQAYRWLRSEAPVYWHEPGGFWTISKHSDAMEVSRAPSPEVFSAESGVLLEDVMHPESRDSHLLPGGHELNATDPPLHRSLRQVWARQFSTEAVGHHEERVREIVRSNLADAAELETANLADVSARIAMQHVCVVLGVPIEDWEMLKGLSTHQVAEYEPESGEQARTLDELCAYFTDALEGRRKHPRDGKDLLTILIRAEVDGEPMPLETQLMLCVELLVASNEATESLLSFGALGLWQYPKQRERLIEDPGLIRNAIDELLRWASPSPASVRRASQETEIRGQRIAEGDFVVVLWPSANRDEEVWGDDADHIDVGRPDVKKHLAFGTGIHVCLGAHQARLTGSVFIEEMLGRYPNYEVVGEPERRPLTNIDQLSDLPVALRD